MQLGSQNKTNLRNMPVIQMVSKEIINEIRVYAPRRSWKAHEINQAFDEYHKLGHKNPSDRTCGSCVSAVMNFWVHYIREYDTNNG